ncbi:MAG: HDOD domain-containing protein [Gammaproteobacteria bacterium]|nr:HDOD domain-containing protein [Gammaproteobacteria bacterium]
MTQIYLARQPIYDRDLTLVGYELLYRASQENYAQVAEGEGDAATAQLLVNALLEIGLREIVGEHYAFVNLTEYFLKNGLPAPIATHQIVLEVLEDVNPDAELIDALKKLREDGCTIALDDFIYDESKRPMVELAQFVKVDLMAMSTAELEEQVKQLRTFPKLRLLAEKVETQEEFEHCKTLGFSYFQGYFFCKPRVITGAKTPSSQLALTRLLAKLQDPDLDFGELQTLVAQDVSLSFRILRYINSACFGYSKQVDSIQRAITMIGLKTIAAWVTIIAMSRVDDKPHELMLTALIRANLAERLAVAFGQNPQHAFTVGLFSALDALTDRSMDSLLKTLPFTEDINTALLHHKGPLGQLLALVLAYERGDWEAVEHSTFDTHELGDNYLESMRWAEDISKALLVQ